uniref:Uncharacterized protein n=1 Tax=Arundo donax TaxID=35708 RepID=A0A0A9CIJ7_ARUDO
MLDSIRSSRTRESFNYFLVPNHGWFGTPWPESYSYLRVSSVCMCVKSASFPDLRASSMHLAISQATFL